MNNILQNRILPYKFSGKIVNRKELVEKLDVNRDKGIFLITAPAGYGKSSLALEFLNFTRKKYSWLNIHQEMNNFYVFVTYLVHSLSRIHKDFGKSTLLMVEEYRDKFKFETHHELIINDITGVFLNDLQQSFEDEIFIVLDDLGKINTSDWIKPAFDRIFEGLPANVHFVITSRSNPEFNTGLLQAKRKILKIGMKELAFTEKETKTLVNDLYELSISDREIKALSANLDGWITGIHLILQSYGNSFPGFRFDKIKVLDDVFNYFSEDIFNSLKPEVQEFLLFTSLLETFTPQLCDELLNIKRSTALIHELLQQNIFIQTNSAAKNDISVSYSYQELFGKFLNMKLKQSRNSSEINTFLKKVSGYYSDKEQFLEAINYSILAGELTNASVMIKMHFQQLFDRGHFEFLWKWLEELGSEIVNKEFKLLYLKSLLLKFFMGNIEESIPMLDKAIKLTNDLNDNEFMVKCCISKSRNLISLGRVREAIGVLKNAGEIEVEPVTRAKLLFLTAYAYYHNSEYDKSLDLLNSASDILDSADNAVHDTTEVRLETHNLYGHIFLIRGDYSKSISYYERAVKNTERMFGRYETICNLVLLYSQSGKFEKASVYLDEARTIAENISIPIFRITYLLAHQAFKFEFGDYEDSIKLLVEMSNIASELNHKYYIFLSYSLIGDSYFSLNKMSKAEEYYDLAFRYLNDNNELERIQFSVCKAFLLIRTEPSSEIEPVLTDAYQFYESKKMTYSRIQISFHLADYYLKTRNYEKTLHFLKEVLKIAEEKEYNSFIQREICNFRPLFDFAAANKLYVNYIKFQNSAFLEKKNSELISAESRKRLLKINDSLIDIQLNLFGKCEVRIRGKNIEDSAWTKKKWKIIFIYLMLESGRSITKDKFIDQFYPDTPLESADNIFHQVISKFRNLVKFTYDNGTLNNSPETEEKKKSTVKKTKKNPGILTMPALVIYEGKLLQISDDFTYLVDSVEFERLYRQLPSLKDPDSRARVLKQAIEMYKGDFMEGNYETWCEELRSKYRLYLVSMSEELISILFNNEDHTNVLHFSENLLKFDKLNLAGYEYMIRSMIEINKPQIAKVRYTQLQKNYRREYDEVLPEKISLRFEALISN
ncbi:MAG: hypothetical protein HOP31_00610 [Ignavibacteria bacterium]|nr:hypothetical protein [Ignavibacteria bacterium]